MCAFANGTALWREPPDRERGWADPANSAFTFTESEYSSESVTTQHGERQVRDKPTNFKVRPQLFETSPTHSEAQHDHNRYRSWTVRGTVVVLALPLIPPSTNSLP